MIKCSAILKNGKQCNRIACLEGLCTSHFKYKYGLIKRKYTRYESKYLLKI